MLTTLNAPVDLAPSVPTSGETQVGDLVSGVEVRRCVHVARGNTQG